MTILTPVVAVSPLRQRLIDEMEIRRFGYETQRNYIRDVARSQRFSGARRTPRRRKMYGASGLRAVKEDVDGLPSESASPRDEASR
jgi:hypothetical protein